MIFHRANYSIIWITLSSSETLGLLASDYLEDFFGTDGQVTIHHMTSDQRWPVVMLESSNELASHEVFTGWVSLNTLPDGLYQIEGRVRDQFGNMAILSAYSAPLGTETVEPMAFFIEPGIGSSVQLRGLVLQGGHSLAVPAPSTRIAVPGRAQSATIRRGERRLSVRAHQDTTPDIGGPS